MKLAVIVTEFPKTTETFILRDLMTFLDAGVDLRIYHLTPWRRDQILHDFAAPLAARARHIPLFGRESRGAAWRQRSLARTLTGRILRHQAWDGKIAAKSLALMWERSHWEKSQMRFNPGEYSGSATKILAACRNASSVGACFTVTNAQFLAAMMLCSIMMLNPTSFPYAPGGSMAHGVGPVRSVGTNGAGGRTSGRTNGSDQRQSKRQCSA